MLLTLVYFLVTLLLLITVHELGHFLVARWCGVKVLRFSFGFGKVLASWQDKKGTEYALSILPLGGYVKMLDENEAEVAASEKNRAFNNKSVLARMAIVLAGPFFNFVFAFTALWFSLMIGIHSLAPIIAQVKPGSIAANAGIQPKDEIRSLNQIPIQSWHDFQYALMPLVGSEENVELQVMSLATQKQRKLMLPLAHWQLETKKPDLLASLGIEPFIPSIPPIVGDVMSNSPASSAGLKSGDKVLMFNNQPLHDWLALVEYVKKNPNSPLKLIILRDGHRLNFSLVIASQEEDGIEQGFLGIRSQKVSWPPQWLRFQRQAPLPAIATAAKQTLDLTTATFSLIGRFVSGKIAMDAISGPVGIAQGAGESGRSGVAYYLSFLALVSISLGVLNLLPIPLLDGGHFLFLLIELIKGRPLSESSRSIAMYLGMMLLVALMFLALSNDISRLAG